MEKYKLAGKEVINPTEDDLNDLLPTHYHQYKTQRPLCLCRDPGLNLYIARHGEKYVLKRWPQTGDQHHYTCPKFEPPAESSGAGALVGSAIKEDPHTGITSLKLGFSLQRINRAAPMGKMSTPTEESADQSQDATKTEERKLTLKSIMHYLWDAARLTRWGDDGFVRHWGTISDRLRTAATDASIHKKPLGHFLYIPPIWNKDEAARQAQARKAFIGQFVSPKGPKKIMMILGEVKAVELSQFGLRMTLKSMPDTPVFMKQDLWERLQGKYLYEISRWREEEKLGHLIACMTVSLSPTGSCQMEDAAFMSVTNNWLPVSNFHETLLTSTAVSEKRQFLKPLPYNLGRGRTLPTIILLDSKPLNTNLFISVPDESEVLIATRDDLIATSKGHSVIWDIQEPTPIDELLAKYPAVIEPSPRQLPLDQAPPADEAA